jgi:hypothetical protein
MLSALTKYVINRLMHGLFHIALVIRIKYVISNVIIICYRRANPGPTPYLWKFLYLIIIIGMSVLPSHDFMLSRSHRGFKMYWFLIVASHITIVHRRVGEKHNLRHVICLRGNNILRGQ